MSTKVEEFVRKLAINCIPSLLNLPDKARSKTLCKRYETKEELIHLFF